MRFSSMFPDDSAICGQYLPGYGGKCLLVREVPSPTQELVSYCKQRHKFFVVKVGCSRDLLFPPGQSGFLVVCWTTGLQ